ncbi:MAG: DUF2161 family putative PD-(D/E)XK-type phosphodiesterase [Pseudomonadota bacterium]
MPAKRRAKKAPVPLRETDLYPPVKAFLERQGYTVKSEVGAADVVGCRDDAPPVIVELKVRFALAVFHQAVARLAISDAVYVAVAHRPGKPFQAAVKANITLCRRLGLGLLTVRLRDGHVTAHLDPAPYAPRKSVRRSGRLLREFDRRVGDPNTGGATRQGIVTTYRQDALKCLAMLLAHGPTKASVVAETADVPTARRIMSDDHYGWFERVATGIYAATPVGRKAAKTYAAQLAAITDAAAPPPEPVA